MSGGDADRFVADCRERVEARLDAILPAVEESPRVLHEAMRYAVLSNGKRLRPALAFAAAHALGEEAERVLPLAAAVELIHVYSLVHDDLPAMDDDAMRRGQPSVHVRFGEANAILTGDALLAAAFEELAADGVPSEAVRRVAAAAGSRLLVGGQVDDLAFAPQGSTLEQIVSIHARKTVGLFAAAVVGAARICGASVRDRAALDAFADHFGHAFQIADDLEEDDPAECSILRTLDRGAAADRARAHLESATRLLDGFGERGDPLRALAEIVGRKLA